MSVWNRYLLLSVMTIGCGSKPRVEPRAPVPAPGSEQASGTVTPQSGDLALDGKGLYNQYCASCHGGLDQSSAARANANAIQGALQNIPEMQGIPALAEDQVNALVVALNKTPPGKAKGKP